MSILALTENDQPIGDRLTFGRIFSIEQPVGFGRDRLVRGHGLGIVTLGRQWPMEAHVHRNEHRFLLVEEEQVFANGHPISFPRRDARPSVVLQQALAFDCTFEIRIGDDGGIQWLLQR